MHPQGIQHPGAGPAQQFGIQAHLLRPEVYQKYVAGRKFLDTYFDLRNPEWGSPVETEPRVLWTRDDSDCLVFITEVIVDAPLEETVRWMKDDEFCTKIDTKRKSTQSIRVESPDCDVVHLWMNGNMIVSERDVVAYRFRFFEDPNTFRALMVPADDLNVPPAKDVVRADLRLTSLLLTRTPDNRTKMVNYSMMNPKSSMPMFMMRGKIKDVSTVSVDLKKAIENNFRSRQGY